MIRNLKVLIAAAMALMAFGALSATAHAAEEKFHCSVEPCTATLAPDETAGTTTAHHVFVVKGKTSGGVEASASFTCNQVTGEATSATKTATELTFTNIKYENSAAEAKCKIGASETVVVNFNGCDYNFKSLNGSTSTAQVHLLCPTGKVVQLLINGVVCLDISPFTSTGLGYHDSGIGGAKQIATATANVVVPNAALTLTNISTCTALGLASTTGATYTTGNTLVKADGGGTVWFE